MRRGVKKQQGQKGTIRIISGQFKGRKLPVLDAEGLRPTTDRTKETLFNWLMSGVRGSECLDCYAGSGGLGFEALSRGAKSVVFIEKDEQAATQLKQNLSTLKVGEEQATLIKGDALAHIAGSRQGFDLVFIDPPFNHSLVPKTIEALSEGHLVRNNGLIYIECENENADYDVPDSWHCLKQKQTKQVDYRLYQHQE